MSSEFSRTQRAFFSFPVIFRKNHGRQGPPALTNPAIGIILSISVKFMEALPRNYTVLPSKIRSEAPRPQRRGTVRHRCLTREWGRAPHEPIPCALRNQPVGESRSLGKPEKAGLILPEARVGRPTVSSECCRKWLRRYSHALRVPPHFFCGALRRHSRR